jgi:mono/diheme cytochrome c family protein
MIKHIKTKFILFAVIAVTFVSLAYKSAETDRNPLNDNTPLWDILIALGESKPSHYIENPDAQKIAIGKELVYKGRADLPDGGKSRYISKFYVCTDCHNQVQEDPFMPESNPDTRLDYAIKNDLKFLQATTFWGMVNRESWYNEDYVKKYGALVEPAHKSLAESTQLCARECSSGRYLEDWELEAIMQYYWTIQIKLGDLKLSDVEMEKLKTAWASNVPNPEIRSLLKSKIMLYSPATFVEKHEKEAAQNLKADASRGEQIWKRSCMTCHREYGPSQLILDDSRQTMQKFKRRLGDGSNFDLYQILRHGTHAEPGHRQYMPLYPLERMSLQQIADIQGYIESKSK